MRVHSVLYKCLVIVIPVCFLIFGLHFNRLKFSNDPDYIYLMNSLCICDGQSVGHIDNPGTTVMQVGAATIFFLHTFDNPEHKSVLNHVLTEPGKFVEGICKAIIVLNALILALLGLFVLHKKGSVWLALFLQASTLLSVNILDHVYSKLSPEPLLFFVTGMYVGAILHFYYSKNKHAWKHVIIFSLITGLGLATKATFLPLIVLPLVLFTTAKKKFAYLLGIIPAFVLFTIPAIAQYESMYFWFRNLIRYTGIYGHGEKGFIDTSTYLPNIINILKSNTYLSLTLTAAIIVLLISLLINKKRELCWDTRILGGLAGVNIFAILLVAKHYTGNHYLIPELLLFGITSWTIINLTAKLLKLPSLSNYLLPLLTLILVATVGWEQTPGYVSRNEGHRLANMEIDSTNNLIATKYSDYTIVNYYFRSLNKFTSLKFGNNFAKNKLNSALTSTYPQAYFYEFSQNIYLNWNEDTHLDSITKVHGNKILLLNAPGDKKKIEEMAKREFPLKEVYMGKAQIIYELDTTVYIQNKSRQNTITETRE